MWEINTTVLVAYLEIQTKKALRNFEGTYFLAIIKLYINLSTLSNPLNSLPGSINNKVYLLPLHSLIGCGMRTCRHIVNCSYAKLNSPQLQYLLIQLPQW